MKEFVQNLKVSSQSSLHQPKLDAHPLSEPRKTTITNKLWNLIVNKSLPLQLLISEELKEYSAALEPRYSVPTTAYFVEKLVLVAQLDKMKNVTIYIWKYEKMRSYIAFSVHGITDDWELVKGLLSVKAMPCMFMLIFNVQNFPSLIYFI